MNSVSVPIRNIRAVIKFENLNSLYQQVRDGFNVLGPVTSILAFTIVEIGMSLRAKIEVDTVIRVRMEQPHAKDRVQQH